MLSEVISSDQLSTVISHAIAPSFLLGAVAGFASILTARMGGILERIRVLNAIGQNDQDRLHLKTDIPRLKRRAALINWALLCDIGSGVLAAILVIFAFTAAFLNFGHVFGAGILFMSAMGLLVCSLVVFAVELKISLTEFDHFA